ncbi:MAG: polysaccharide deacetylase family protein [Desulfuromonadales bacterium]|nr:polysaccharide deacetylase family protein [Desulfuromonadales bacterium]
MCKFSVLVAAALFCLVSLGQTAVAGQVNAFIYHRFDETKYPSTNISSAVFAEQLAYLQQQNYTVLSIGEVVRRLRSGENLPDKGAVLTVDDGCRSFADVAMPIVRQYGFPISLFVNTDAVGSRGYLDWAQLQALQQEGVEIGNHTASHPYMVEKKQEETQEEWRQRIIEDLKKAEQQFMTQLGKVPELFVYPYGEYSVEVIDVVKSLGFKAALAQQSGVIHSTHDLYTLPRFPMGGPYATLAGFINKLSMKPLVVPVENPVSPVVLNNPPDLTLNIANDDVDLSRMNCFVQGENSCRVVPVAGQAGWYKVVAEKALTGRRNKYTLTVPGREGGWHWYSHLWINADFPAVDGRGLTSAAGPEVDFGKTVQAVPENQ